MIDCLKPNAALQRRRLMIAPGGVRCKRLLGGPSRWSIIIVCDKIGPRGDDEADDSRVPHGPRSQPVPRVVERSRCGRSGADSGASAAVRIRQPGDHRAVGLGVWEARCAFGPGYRIYFAKPGSTITLLLLGGDKSSQRSDIRTAQRHWTDYLEEHARGTSK